MATPNITLRNLIRMGFDAYAFVSDDPGEVYYDDPSINRLFLVEQGAASVTASIVGSDNENLTVSLNGADTFGYFTAWGEVNAPAFTIDEMQRFSRASSIT